MSENLFIDKSLLDCVGDEKSKPILLQNEYHVIDNAAADQSGKTLESSEIQGISKLCYVIDR